MKAPQEFALNQDLQNVWKQLTPWSQNLTAQICAELNNRPVDPAADLASTIGHALLCVDWSIQGIDTLRLRHALHSHIFASRLAESNNDPRDKTSLTQLAGADLHCYRNHAVRRDGFECRQDGGHADESIIDARQLRLTPTSRHHRSM